MKDLDFDELDRAVSSLMTGIPKTATPVPSGGDERVLNLSSASPVGSTETVSMSPLTLDSTPEATESPLISRQGGRFMDMVRSSPSNRPTTTRSLPSSRQGVTLNPTSTVITAEPMIMTIPEAAADKDETAHSSFVSDWPDPIDMQAKILETTAATTDSSNVTVTVESSHDDLQSEPATLLAAETEAETTSYTPFLTDSKVEKRPLGAFTEPTTEEAVASETPSSDTPSPEEVGDEPADVQLAANPLDTAFVLPAELHKDVMAIEADQETTIPSEKPEPTAPTVPATSETAPVRPSISTGPGSIAQQYKTEPTTSDTTHAGIYDAETYKQPLAHPVKKKSGWLLVLWIVLLLAIGSGGAAILYYFNII